MKLKKFLNERWIGVYILFFIAVLYFIYSLCFMTNFYRFFYDGNTAMLEFYEELQLLNKYVFKTALTILILAVFTLFLEIDKKKVSMFHCIYLIGFFVYEINDFSIFIGTIPYYKDKYLSLDFSILENYNVSTLMFSLNYILNIGILISLLLTIILFINRMLKMVRVKRGVKSNG